MKTALIFLTALSAAVIIYFLPPQSGGIYMKCPFLDITGLYCPGCGSMRCLHNLLHGNILRAMDLNIFTVMTIPFLIFAYVRFAIREFNGNTGSSLVIKPFNVWSVLIFIIVFWIIRNLPLYPFTILAP